MVYKKAKQNKTKGPKKEKKKFHTFAHEILLVDTV